MSFVGRAVLQMRRGLLTEQRHGTNVVKPLALKVIATGRSFGPYLAIELLLPGGSLVALLLWLYHTYLRAPNSQARDETEERRPGSRRANPASRYSRHRRESRRSCYSLRRGRLRSLSR